MSVEVVRIIGAVIMLIGVAACWYAVTKLSNKSR